MCASRLRAQKDCDEWPRSTVIATSSRPFEQYRLSLTIRPPAGMKMLPMATSTSILAACVAVNSSSHSMPIRCLRGRFHFRCAPAPPGAVRCAVTKRCRPCTAPGTSVRDTQSSLGRNTCPCASIIFKPFSFSNVRFSASNTPTMGLTSTIHKRSNTTRVSDPAGFVYIILSIRVLRR